MLPLTRHLRDALEKASAERQAPMLPGKKKRLGGWTEGAWQFCWGQSILILIIIIILILHIGLSRE